MPAKSQRGIPRPRVSEADAELRQGILKLFRSLQKEKSLAQIAADVGVSEKTLRRYLNDKCNPPPTLGGDTLFRLCEAGHAITCRGKTLQCVDSHSTAVSKVKTEQLPFEFVASIDLLLPSRKLVGRIERISRRNKVV